MTFGTWDSSHIRYLIYKVNIIINDQLHIYRVSDIHEFYPRYSLFWPVNYIIILQIILNIGHLENRIAPIVTDWPGQLFIHKAITLLSKSNERVAHLSTSHEYEQASIKNSKKSDNKSFRKNRSNLFSNFTNFIRIRAFEKRR